jgi:hypothetical protein
LPHARRLCKAVRRPKALSDKQRLQGQHSGLLHVLLEMPVDAADVPSQPLVYGIHEVTRVRAVEAPHRVTLLELREDCNEPHVRLLIPLGQRVVVLAHVPFLEAEVSAGVKVKCLQYLVTHPLSSTLVEGGPEASAIVKILLC